MTDTPAADWQPLSRPGRRGLNVDWDAPFPRLALCHLLSVSGETLVVLSLAGSFFFKVDPSQGRQRVILGLLFTMAPFALVGPFIGPAIDRVRGGHRRVIQLTLVLRVAVAVAMMVAVIGDSFALFPEAFAMLVLAKTYQIAKAALVPSVVAGDLELVEANSKLQLLSGLSAVVAGGIGGALLQIGPAWVLGMTTLTFVAATAASLRLHLSDRGEADEAAARAPGHVPAPTLPGLAVAAFSMSTLRFVVGFLTFLLAFELRGDGGVTPLARAVHTTLVIYKRLSPRTVVTPLEGPPPSWYFGVVIAASVGGGLIGAVLAPPLRRVAAEERILIGAGVLGALSAVAAMLLDGLGSYAVLALGIAVAAALGKQAFDAVVQRDVDEFDRGRAFSGFEARFQITWVLGALVPSVVHVPTDVGAGVIVVSAVVAAVAMATGMRPALDRSRPGDRIGRLYVSRSGKSGMSGSSSSSGNG